MKVEKLLDVVQIKNPKPEKFSGEKRYYSTGNINEHNVSENFELVKFENRPSRANVEPIENSVGFAKMKSTAKTLLVTKNYSECIFSTGMNFLLPSENIISKYLYYYLISPYFLDLKDKYSGQGIMGGLSNKDLNLFKIPVPSLDEQEKIVKKLDKLHESRIYYKKIKNSELVYYDKMYESLLNEVFQKLISAFPNVLLKEKTYIAGRIGWKGLSKKDYKEEGPLFINVSSLNHGQYVNFQESKHISEQRYFESENIGLVEGDVLICKDGSIGKIGIVGKLEELATVNSSLLIVRSLEGLMPKYLYYVFASPQFQLIVKSRIEGSTVPHLYQRDIKNFSIPLPPLEVQKESVKKLDRLYELIQDIKKNVELIQKGNDNLFKSVLKTEFSYE
tara:strand:+ start:135 stop:1307 length:1173 start_codon:yes stop_codon:yes gene_type:complete